MADISKLTRLIDGIIKNVDLESNTLVVQDIKLGGASGTVLNQTNLDTLTDGSDAAGLHNHDSQYHTQAELGSTTDGSSGASLIGVDQTPAFTNISGADVQSILESIDTALNTAGGTTFEDDTFRIQNSGDTSKQIAFDGANIATSTTRTITMPNTDVDLGDIATNTSNIANKANTTDVVLRDGTQAFTGEQSMGSNKLTNLAAPTNDNDAARLIDVQNAQAGVKTKEPVQLAHDSNITDLGAGAPLNVDGEAVQANDRILVYGQTDTTENGIYVVDVVGSGSDGQWSRATDFDGTPASEVTLGASVFVNSGTNYANTVFILNDSDSPNEEIDVGTETQLWVIFSRAENITAGDGLDKSGLDLSVDVTDLAGSGLEDDGSNNLRIAAAAAGNGLTGGAGSALSVEADATGGAGLATAINISANGVAVQVDDTTIEGGVGGALRIKDDGITNAKINSSAAIEFSKMEALTADKMAATNGSGEITASSVDTADVVTLTDGSFVDKNLHFHPEVIRTFVAGEAFAANTTHVVRMGMDELGETVGRVYKADMDASSDDKFYAIGVIEGSGFAGATAGVTSVQVVLMGVVTLGSSDTNFSANEAGKPVHLNGTGNFDIVENISYSTDDASYRIGMVTGFTQMFIGHMQLNGIN